MEIVYVFAILGLFTISSISIQNFYRNMIAANKQVTDRNTNRLTVESISFDIMEYIKEEDFKNTTCLIDEYNVAIKKITNSTATFSPKSKFIKDYTNSQVYVFTKSMSFYQNNRNYFIFSLSSTPIHVVYDDYIVGYIEEEYLYGIEEGRNKTINISSDEDNLLNKVFVYEFDKNIVDYDFYVAKLEKDKKESYILYMTYEDKIIEIYNINK